MIQLSSLGAAIKDGWQVYDRKPDGSYVLRKQTNGLWVLGLFPGDQAVPDAEC